MPVRRAITDDEVLRLLGIFEKLRGDRGVDNSVWQAIAELVLPEYALFEQTTLSPNIMANVYDSTAMHSNLLFSAGAYALLTNPAAPWFFMSTTDYDVSRDRDAYIYLYHATEVMRHELNRPESAWDTSIIEGFLEFAPFGNMTLLMEEQDDLDGVLFQTQPLYNCYYIEGRGGQVDTLYRVYTRSLLQLVERWGVECLSPKALESWEKGDYLKMVPGVHVLYPRQKFTGRAYSALRKRYASIFIDTEAKHVMHESGYDEKPFYCCRMNKTSGSTYGFGVGKLALADVKMLMRVMQLTLRGGQKIVDPALLVPDNMFMKPIRTVPGGLNYYRRNKGTLKDIGQMPSGDPGFGIDFSKLYHERIRDMWMISQLQLAQSDRMTATEVIQRTEERMRLVGPMLGRTKTELFGPMLNRLFARCRQQGKILEPPEQLRGARINYTYTSSIARAQEQIQAQGLLRVLEILTQLAQYKQDTFDRVDESAITQGLFEMFNVDVKYLYSPEQYAKNKQAKEEAIAKQQQAENLAKQGQGVAALAQAAETLPAGAMDSMEMQ